MSKTCNGCGNAEMQAKIPYVAHESAMSRADRQNKRLWIVVILLVVVLVVSNCAWLWYESQFETVEETTVTQDNDNGYNNYVGKDGDINYGEAEDC